MEKILKSEDWPFFGVSILYGGISASGVPLQLFSNFLSPYNTFFRGLGLEPSDTFEEALELEEERLNKGWFWPRYKYAGLYAQQLKRYHQYFEEEQVKIIKFDDFITNTKAVIKEIFDYLGVEEEVEINLSVQHNASAYPKIRR